jgi:hypothetical protein
VTGAAGFRTWDLSRGRQARGSGLAEDVGELPVGGVDPHFPFRVKAVVSARPHMAPAADDEQARRESGTTAFAFAWLRALDWLVRSPELLKPNTDHSHDWNWTRTKDTTIRARGC